MEAIKARVVDNDATGAKPTGAGAGAGPGAVTTEE
jgi:hypothetical protein